MSDPTGPRETFPAPLRGTPDAPRAEIDRLAALIREMVDANIPPRFEAEAEWLVSRGVRASSCPTGAPRITPELYETLLKSARGGVVGDPWSAGKELVDLRLEVARLREAAQRVVNAEFNCGASAATERTFRHAMVELRALLSSGRDAPVSEPPKRIPYGEERRHQTWRAGVGIPCHDCGVALGELHKDGCYWEECETCGAQRIGCSCCVVCRAHEKDATWCACGACLDRARESLAGSGRAALPSEPSEAAIRAAQRAWWNYDGVRHGDAEERVEFAVRAAYAMDFGCSEGG